MIYGLYILYSENLTWGDPILYSTDIRKLRKVMASICNSEINIGTPDITNQRDTNSYTELGKIPFGKIVEMPTLI